MHDKPQTFLTVVDKTSVHRQVLHGIAICVRSFEFTTGDNAKRFSKNPRWLPHTIHTFSYHFLDVIWTTLNYLIVDIGHEVVKITQ